jgi:Fe2+ transport system protein FeoA
MPLTLAELPIGPYATVVSMPTGRAALTRLREMGIVPGAKVKVTRRAPLGEPIEISVRGSRLSMRNHEAAFIGTDHSADFAGVMSAGIS